MKAVVTSFLSLMGAMACLGQVDRIRLEKLDDHLERAVQEQGIPGAAVAVVHGTNIVFSRGYGPGITPKTPFKIGSLSKSFVALAILQLEEQGRVELDSSVRRYLPWFRMGNESESDKITLRHLLHHRSGITYPSGSFRPDRNYDRELNNLIKACPLMHVDSPPGQRFAYSNVGYDFLGAIVTTVSGLPLPEYVRIHIFEPLGMRQSYASVTEASQQGLAVGHRFLFGRPVVWDNVLHHPPIATGGLMASAEDMGRYVSALMTGGTPSGHQILLSSNLAQMFRPYGDSEKSEYYALGWQVATVGDPPVRVMSHGGSLDGFMAHVAFRPDEKTAVVFLINASSATRVGMIQLVHEVPHRFLHQLPPTKLTERHPMYYLTATALWLIGLSTFAVVGSIAATVFLLRRWRRNGMPTPTKRLWLTKWWLPIAGHGLVSVLMLWLLPKAFGVGIKAAVQSSPDWGTLGVGIGILALIWGALRCVIVGRRLVRARPGTSHR